MFVWVQVIFFIVTNAPSLIKAIRELIEMFNGDKKLARALLDDMREAKKKAPKDGKKTADVMKEIIDNYKDKAVV